ncbi:MAG: hypothetical protein KBG63_02575 [Acetobacterium sp.]|nr:hypothetical protein [Acetobacterium sp.]
MRGNSSNNVGHDQEKSEAREQRQQNQRIKIEKAIVVAALIMILMAVLVMPKIEVYQQNKTILAEKIRYNQELPDKMTEETYLRQLQTLDEALSQTRSELPEYLDTVSLYDAIAKMAEVAQINLISLEFEQAEIQVDDRLGLSIDAHFIENGEKTIMGPDGKFLTTCQFTAVCSGNDQAFIAFIKEINQSVPIIRVIGYKTEKVSATEKLLRLKLESYGFQEGDQEK